MIPPSDFSPAIDRSSGIWIPGLQPKFHYDGSFIRLDVKMRSAPPNLKAHLQIQVNHCKIALSCVGNDHLEPLLLRKLNLPLLLLRTVAAAAKLRKHAGSHNVQTARPWFDVKVGITQKRRAPHNRPIHNHPVRFEPRPFLRREQVLGKRRKDSSVNVEKHLKLLRNHDPPKLNLLVPLANLHFL